MRALVTALLLISGLAHAEPGTYTITPTALSHDGSGGNPDGYRIYEGCDLGTQAKGLVVEDPAVVGSSFTLAGDDATPPVLCAVAFNSAGEGGFSNVVTLQTSVLPPGDGTISLDCTFDADTGEVKACTGVVSP